MAKPTKQTPITPAMADINLLFGDRLTRLLADCADTARLAGLEDKVIRKILITGLLYEVIKGAYAMGLDEDDYLQLCLTARRALAAKLTIVTGSGPTRTA
jgi:hypothetical protein